MRELDRLKKRLAESRSSYTGVRCGDIVAACDACAMDPIIAALWQGSHGLKPDAQVAVLTADLQHLLERTDGPVAARNDVPGGQESIEPVAADHLPPGRRKRNSQRNAGPDTPPASDGGRESGDGVDG